MYSKGTLTKMRDGCAGKVANARRANESVNRKVEQFESDSSRSANWKSEEIKKAREAALPAPAGDLQAIRDVVESLKPHRELWANTELLLSRARFFDDDTADALTKLRLAGELASYPLPLLIAVMRDAILEKDFALVWACVVAGRKAAVGDLPDWSHLQVPDQREALLLIDGCDALLAEMEMIVSAIGGMSMSPAQKLTLARRMSPQPTRHNSPGRPIAA